MTIAIANAEEPRPRYRPWAGDGAPQLDGVSASRVELGALLAPLIVHRWLFAAVASGVFLLAAAAIGLAPRSYTGVASVVPALAWRGN